MEKNQLYYGDNLTVLRVNSLVFLDSKRPITKKVLQRVDLSALLSRADRRELTRSTNERLMILGLPALEQGSIDSFAWPRSSASQQLMFPGLV